MIRRQQEKETSLTPDGLIDGEALWAYRFMKHTGQDVDDNFPSARIQAFKKLCITEGDYKVKQEDVHPGQLGASNMSSGGKGRTMLGRR